MKTSLLVLCLVATAATSVFAETYRVPIERTRQKQKREKPTPLAPGKVDGVIPRAVRGGNPLQMLNPRAPRKYGTSLEAVSLDLTDPKIPESGGASNSLSFDFDGAN